MKHLCLFTALCFLSLSATAQSDTIMPGNYFTPFKQNGRPLSYSKLERMIRQDKEAYTVYQTGKRDQVFSLVFSAAGGYMLGYSLATAAMNKPVNIAEVVLGVGCTAISIPLGISAVKKFRRAAEIYNLHKRSVSVRFQPEFDLAFTGNRIGMIMRF